MNQNQNQNDDAGTMFVSFQDLEVLPEIPAGTKRLYCSGNKLIALPELPESLEVLHCGSNNLTELPALPPRLRSLTCNSNQINSLPALPASLLDLNCAQNKLKDLPQLPAELQILECTRNQLQKLPILPETLEFLSVAKNKLTEIPKLPLGLVVADFDDNELGMPYSSLYKSYKDSFRYNPGNDMSYGDIVKFIKEVNAINIANADILNLKVKRENYPQNTISQEEFVDGENVDVLYSQDQYADLQAGREVNIKPSMVHKHQSIKNLIAASRNGRIKNPLTRDVVAHREVRRLKFLDEGPVVGAAEAAAGAGQAGGKKRRANTKKKSQKKRVHKSRKNKSSK